MRSQESQRVTEEAKRRQEQPGGARKSQEEPGRARRQ